MPWNTLYTGGGGILAELYRASNKCMRVCFLCIRVSWGQLQRDVGRDRVRIDGEMVTPSDVTRIVVGLASRITERLAARNSQRRLGRHSGGSGRFGTAPLQVWMHAKSWDGENCYGTLFLVVYQ